MWTKGGTANDTVYQAVLDGPADSWSNLDCIWQKLFEEVLPKQSDYDEKNLHQPNWTMVRCETWDNNWYIAIFPHVKNLNDRIDKFLIIIELPYYNDYYFEGGVDPNLSDEEYDRSIIADKSLISKKLKQSLTCLENLNIGDLIQNRKMLKVEFWDADDELIFSYDCMKSL